MNTRMDKYKNTDKTLSRVDRNKEMYTQVDEKDIEDLNLTNNISIIDADTRNLDINSLKALLDEKYKKRATTNFEDVVDEPDDVEITKEYDLNKVLDKARNSSETDYDIVRHRKIRESEYEILNNLNLKRQTEPEEIETISQEEATLINLIKTVNENEFKSDSLDSEDMLDDLKGNGDTEVLDPIITAIDDTLDKPTIIEELEKTKKLYTEEILNSIDNTNVDNDDTQTSEIVKDKTENLTNTFYTGKLSIKDSDLDDFNELANEINKSSILIKILIVLGIIVLIALVVVLLNKYMNLGLF